MNFNASIFKAYDIRGLVKSELSEDLAYRLGRAFSVFLRAEGVISANKAIVVGRDMRESSPLLAAAVMRGIQDEGVRVIDIGLSTSPFFYFSCANYPEHAGGIMVTASHNPAEYNGFKMLREAGTPIGHGSGMEAIRDLVEQNDFSNPKTPGNINMKDTFPDYSARIFELVNPENIRPLRIVIDCGNGMAGVTLPRILEKVPVQASYLFLEQDGRFPNHEANPLKVETLKALQEKVVEQKADLGLALDGDADRIGLVDEKGNVVAASYVGALLGLELLRDHPQGHYLYDIRSSMIVKEVWEKAGASTESCMVGHSNIKKKMRDRAVFAGELSQHFYFADMFNMECTDLALLYILQMLSREQRTLSELVRPLQKYFHSGEINFEVKDKEKVMAEVEKEYKKSAKEVSRPDGLWMKFPWGWLSLRPSNTESVLRLNLEATGQEKMEEELKRVKKIIGATK